MPRRQEEASPGLRGATRGNGNLQGDQPERH